MFTVIGERSSEIIRCLLMCSVRWMLPDSSHVEAAEALLQELKGKGEFHCTEEQDEPLSCPQSAGPHARCRHGITTQRRTTFAAVAYSMREHLHLVLGIRASGRPGTWHAIQIWRVVAARGGCGGGCAASRISPSAGGHRGCRAALPVPPVRGPRQHVARGRQSRRRDPAGRPSHKRLVHPPTCAFQRSGTRSPSALACLGLGFPPPRHACSKSGCACFWMLRWNLLMVKAELGHWTACC
jgi:hypothetical protein